MAQLVADVREAAEAEVLGSGAQAAATAAERALRSGEPCPAVNALHTCAKLADAGSCAIVLLNHSTVAALGSLTRCNQGCAALKCTLELHWHRKSREERKRSTEALRVGS